MTAIALLVALQHGSVLIDTPHYGATISVDRRPIGTAPLPAHPVAVGWHLVEVFARGRPAWARLVFVPPGREVRVRVELAAMPRRALTKSTGPNDKTPTWRLSGRVRVEAAKRGADAALALTERGRLVGEDVLGDDTTVTVDLSGESRLDQTGRPLLRLVDPQRPSRVRMNEAFARWRGLRAGRLLLDGPATTALTVDGLGGRLTLGEWQGEAFGGARGAPVGARPSTPVGGVGVARASGTLRPRLRWIGHDAQHVEAGISLRDQTPENETLGASAVASTVGRALHRARVDLRWRRLRVGYAARGAGRSRLIDPVRSLALAPPELSEWHGPRIGAAARLGPWLIDGHARLRWGVEADRWDAQGALSRSVGRWQTSVLIDGFATRWLRPPQGPFLQNGARGVFSARYAGLTVSGGAAWQTTDATARLLPEGGLRLALPISGPLDLVAEASAQAVDPAILSGDGLLISGHLGVRLR
ncbi:MAG: hypothetical protein ACI9U2_000346 [Bradymonadia bacterium]